MPPRWKANPDRLDAFIKALPRRGRYSRADLPEWASRIGRWKGTLKAVYVYFDNDQAAHAVHNAQALREML